ncbi:MAG TPA: ribosome silencing factor [Kofleriaceae bacterium]|nr:ribosome silencing factor [Kofleriaceae bacterium]
MTKKPSTKRSVSARPSETPPPATQGKARSAAAKAKAKPAEPAAPPPAPPSTEGLDGAMRALAFALDKKALEPVLLDVRELCSFCNYQLIVSGRSDRQVDAIADGIAAGFKEEGQRPLGAEGARTGQWSLLDYGDFVVHVFLHAAREHYDLEGLWNDAPRIPLDVPADARMPLGETYDQPDAR